MKRKLLRSACALLLAGVPLFAAADFAEDKGGGQSQTASARLQFQVDLAKFLFFRVGSGSTTSPGTVDSVNFTMGASIPPGAVMATPGNNTTVNWNGVAPTFAAPAVSLPVEVISNAGQVTVYATVVKSLVNSSGAAIPLSQIVVNSSDPALPAPAIPLSASGPSVSVLGNAWSNLVTQRTATWTFTYAPVVIPPAGSYSGQISFTASAP